MSERIHDKFMRDTGDLHQKVIDLGWARADRGQAANVRVGDRLLPAHIKVDAQATGEEPAYRIDLAVINGVPTCTGVTVTATKPRGILQVDLSALNLADICTDVFAAFSLRIVSSGDGTVGEGESQATYHYTVATAGATDSERRGAAKLIQRSRRGANSRKITPEFLEQVAEIYREHFADKPTAAVMVAFGVGPRMASNYVRRARDADYLSKTTPGKKAM